MRNTLERNGEPVIKNAGTGDKGCRNRWETIRKQVRKAGRTCYGNGTNYLCTCQLIHSSTRTNTCFITFYFAVHAVYTTFVVH